MCHRGNDRHAFTLLEIMVAVAIITLITFSVYQFVRTSLGAIQVSQEMSAQDQELSGFINFIQTQLEDLPMRQQGVLLGSPNKIRGQPADEMQWICRAGHGVLTAAGTNEYRVTLTLQPSTKSGQELEIGLRRQPTNVDERNYNWLPLIKPAAGLEIRYWDDRLSAYIERWTDINKRPTLVRVRMWKTADSLPIEAVLPVPSARMQPGFQ
jgi:prepilin-type N-terminal cleavage/methylation domain-containing protein